MADSSNDFVDLGGSVQDVPSLDYFPYCTEQAAGRSFLGPAGILSQVVRWVSGAGVGRHTPCHATLAAVEADVSEATRLARCLADMGGEPLVFFVEAYPKVRRIAFPFRRTPPHTAKHILSMRRTAERRLAHTRIGVHCGDGVKQIGGAAFYEVLALLRATYAKAKEAPIRVHDEHDKTCCVCIESSVDLVLTCGHAFCAQCIMSWSEQPSPTCPLCRKQLSSLEDSFYTFSEEQVSHETAGDAVHRIFDSEQERMGLSSEGSS